MSYGSEAASAGGAAANTGSAASAGSGVSGALGGTAYGTTAADAITPAASTTSSVGPTMTNAVDTYGYVQQPTVWDTLKDYYSKFNEGYDSTGIDMYKGDKFGNNPQTYGYIYSLSKYGKQPQQQQAPVMQVKYEQPENPYLRKRGY